MLVHECKRGMRVYFGRPNGEQTLGEVVKVNPSKAKVKILENRGQVRNSPIGTIWTVPYSMMRPADGVAPNLTKGPLFANVPVQPAPPIPPLVQRELPFNPFAREDNLLYEALLCCYAGLSPENLTADGEASRTQVQRRSAELNRKIRGICQALGRNVTEDEIYAWDKSRREHAAKRQQTEKGPPASELADYLPG